MDSIALGTDLLSNLDELSCTIFFSRATIAVYSFYNEACKLQTTCIVIIYSFVSKANRFLPLFELFSHVILHKYLLPIFIYFVYICFLLNIPPYVILCICFYRQFRSVT